MFHDSQMSSHPLPNYPRWWWMGIEQWNPMSLEEKQEWYRIRDENVELLTDKKTKQQCKLIIRQLDRAKDSDKTRIWNKGMQRYTYWDFRLQSPPTKNSFIVSSRLPVSQPKTNNPFIVPLGLSVSDLPPGFESVWRVRKIINERTDQNGNNCYLVDWQPTWEDENNIAPDIVRMYQKNKHCCTYHVPNFSNPLKHVQSSSDTLFIGDVL